jgi:antitoxin ParD1/3/4
MSRQSISFTDPNTAWLKQKVEDEGEYRSNSEAVNDLIRKAREIETIRAALIVGERSGLSDQTPEDVREGVKNRLRANGQLPAE